MSANSVATVQISRTLCGNAKRNHGTNPLLPKDNKHLEHWENLLRSSDPLTQLRFVQMAEEAAKNQDILAD